MLNVAAAAELPGSPVDVLVVGGPTHAFGLSRPRTLSTTTSSRRWTAFGEQATDRGPECAEGEGLSEGATSGAVSDSGTELSTTPPESPGRIGGDRRTGRSVLAGADAVA